MTKQVRFAMLGLAFLVLGWTIYRETYELAAVTGLLMALIIWSHFRQGTVMLAAKAYHQRDYDKTELLLKEIKNPDMLAKNRRGYYEFMYGNIELQRNNPVQAERHFQMASLFPLRNENDKGIVLVQLANLSLGKKDFNRTKAYIEKAKTLKLSVRVQGIVQKIEKEIPLIT